MRLATYNVRWFEHLLDAEGRLLDPGGGQAAALATVLRALDADAVLIVEGPDERPPGRAARALERFATGAGLRARRALLGIPSDTQQEIALLYDPDAMTARHDPVGAPRFDGVFQAPGAGEIRWSKPPLEAALRLPGLSLRLVGVHAKSKAPHGARDAAHALRIATENRRKQIAQCLWLRARVDEHLARGESLVVLGDLNDGPGIDEVEALFGRSGVEIVLGEGATRLLDPHALPRRGTEARPATARFPQADGRVLTALVDFVMISQDLRARAPRWRIWHPFDDPACAADPALQGALLRASDHFPVSLDLASGPGLPTSAP